MATLDTHAIIKELIASGTPEKQAEVFVSRFVIKEELASMEQERSVLATKTDISALKAEMKLVETKLEGKIDNLEVKLAGDIRSLGTDIKWVMAVLLAITGMLAKLTFFNG